MSQRQFLKSELSAEEKNRNDDGINRKNDEDTVKGVQRQSGVKQKIKAIRRIGKKYWDKWVRFQEYGSKNTVSKTTLSPGQPALPTGFEEISCIEAEMPDMMLGDIDRVRTTCKECVDNPPNFPTKEQIKSKLISADKYYGLVERSKSKTKSGKATTVINDEGKHEADYIDDEGNLIRPNWRHILDRPLVEQYVLMTNYIRKISILSELNCETPKVKVVEQCREDNVESDVEYKKFADKYKRETRQLLLSLKKPGRKETAVQTTKLANEPSDMSCFPDSSSFCRERSTETIVTSRDFCPSDWDSATNASDPHITENQTRSSNLTNISNENHSKAFNVNRKPSSPLSSDKKTTSGSGSDGTAIPIHSAEGSISLKGASIEPNRKKVTFSPTVQYYQTPVKNRGLYILPLMEETTTISQIRRCIESKGSRNEQSEKVTNDPRMNEEQDVPQPVAELQSGHNEISRKGIGALQRDSEVVKNQSKKTVLSEDLWKKAPEISLLTEESVEIMRYDTETFYPDIPDEEPMNEKMQVQKPQSMTVNDHTPHKITLTQDKPLCFGGKIKSTSMKSHKVRIADGKWAPQVDHNVYQKTSDPKIDRLLHKTSTNKNTFVLLNPKQKVRVGQQRKMNLYNHGPHEAARLIDDYQDIKPEVQTQQYNTISTIQSLEDREKPANSETNNPNSNGAKIDAQVLKEPSLQGTTQCSNVETTDATKSPAHSPSSLRKCIIDTGKSMSVEELKNIFERKILIESPNGNISDISRKNVDSARIVEMKDDNRHYPVIAEKALKVIGDQVMNVSSKGEHSVDNLTANMKCGLAEEHLISDCTITSDNVTDHIQYSATFCQNTEIDHNGVPSVNCDPQAGSEALSNIQHDDILKVPSVNEMEIIDYDKASSDANTGNQSEELECGHGEKKGNNYTITPNVHERNSQEYSDSNSLQYCHKSSSQKKNQNESQILELEKSELLPKVYCSNLHLRDTESSQNQIVDGDTIPSTTRHKSRNSNSVNDAEEPSQHSSVGLATDVKADIIDKSNSEQECNADDESHRIVHSAKLLPEMGNTVEEAPGDKNTDSEPTNMISESDDGKVDVIVESRTYSFNSIYTTSVEQFEQIDYTPAQELWPTDQKSDYRTEMPSSHVYWYTGANNVSPTPITWLCDVIPVLPTKNNVFKRSYSKTESSVETNIIGTRVFSTPQTRTVFRLIRKQ